MRKLLIIFIPEGFCYKNQSKIQKRRRPTWFPKCSYSLAPNFDSLSQARQLCSSKALFFQVPEAHQCKTEEPQLQPRVKTCLSFPKGLTLHSPAATGQFNSFPSSAVNRTFSSSGGRSFIAFQKGATCFTTYQLNCLPPKQNQIFISAPGQTTLSGLNFSWIWL